MERNGVYRKGRMGHVRNINSFRLLQEKAKKWRTPLFTALTLLLVFGISPAVGDNFQASILTAPETQELLKENPDLARKNVIQYAQGIIKECDQYKLTACSQEGRKLLSDLANDTIDTRSVFNAVVIFEEQTTHERAIAACRYAAPQYLQNMKDAQSKLATFADSYAVSLDLKTLNDTVQKLERDVSDVEAAVASCS